MQSMYCKLLTV